MTQDEKPCFGCNVRGDECCGYYVVPCAEHAAAPDLLAAAIEALDELRHAKAGGTQ